MKELPCTWQLLLLDLWPYKKLQLGTNDDGGEIGEGPGV
jgi:hypothetical protein